MRWPIIDSSWVEVFAFFSAATSSSSRCRSAESWDLSTASFSPCWSVASRLCLSAAALAKMPGLGASWEGRRSSPALEWPWRGARARRAAAFLRYVRREREEEEEWRGMWYSSTSAKYYHLRLKQGWYLVKGVTCLVSIVGLCKISGFVVRGWKLDVIVEGWKTDFSNKK